jgi:type IV pilus assembly protein PilB
MEIESNSAVEIIEILLKEAFELRASDLHLDPASDSFIARLRVDGILHDAYHLPLRIQNEILARLKILAGLRTDEHQAPQDGRFRFQVSVEQSIDVRVSISSTYYGENAVLRLLSFSNRLSQLSSLGFSDEQIQLLQRAVLRPHGMILITGPTGSGKTSTLYALIHLLNTRSVSIITIEDPIEYALEGIIQVPANRQAGLTFADGLRSILRQDPNIIGIGEIRDAETASLATNAALTGHLVLSTLHTTDAPTTLPRLMDMRVEPYLISSTVSMVVGQRLMRKLCKLCRTEKPLRKDQEILISLIPGPVCVFETNYESLGCSACSGTGRFGRIGIFEIMPMNSTLREATIRKASGRELYELALEQGMLPMLHDGIQKAAAGLVSLDEVLALMSD